VADGFPDGYRLVAPDLRSFGRTERKPVDATRGLRDWSDDLHALVEALGWAGGGRVHIAGWSNGGGVAQQHAIDHGAELASIALVAPLSPHGFGGSKDVQGTPCWDDWAGTGGGTAAPEFVRRMATGDDSEDDPVSSPRVVMRTFFWSPTYKAPDEDELLAEVLLTAVGVTGCPGDVTTSPNWPGVAPGGSGVNNAFAGKWCDPSLRSPRPGPCWTATPPAAARSARSCSTAAATAPWSSARPSCARRSWPTSRAPADPHAGAGLTRR
jgi:hypothetical protein